MHSAVTLGKLRDAIAHHDRQLKKLRKKRESYLQTAAGTLYAHSKEENSGKEDMINLMRQAAEAMTLSMSANRPRFLVSAVNVDQESFAVHYEQALNTYAEQMHLEETLQECVRNAFYFQGHAKVSFATSPGVLIEADEWMSDGQTFCGSISPNHLCYDTDAPDFRYCSFIGDRYRVRFDDAVNDDRFDSKVRTQMKKTGPDRMRQSYTEWGKPLGSPLSSTGEFEEFIYLADIFLPKDGEVYTFPCDHDFNLTSIDPLFHQYWKGREEGPYYHLNLGPIPDKITPSSPASNLMLLHELANSVYRKLSSQSKQQKNILAGRKGLDEDASAIREAQDGDVLLLDDPNSVEPLRFFGPDQALFGFALNAIQQFDAQGGGVKHQLGVGPSAETVGQEQMVSEKSAGYQAFYQARYNKFVSDIAQELSRLLYEDQVTKIPMTRKIDGTDISFDDNWDPAVNENARQGPQSDYKVRIDPYSMGYKSPGERLAQLDAAVDRAMPILPLLQEQGMYLDIQWYLKQRARLTDIPEMEQLFKQMPPPEDSQRGGGSHERTLAGNTNREYTHRTAPSGNGDGNQNAMIQQMMAAGQPQGEMQ